MSTCSTGAIYRDHACMHNSHHYYHYIRKNSRPACKGIVDLLGGLIASFWWRQELKAESHDCIISKIFFPMMEIKPCSGRFQGLFPFNLWLKSGPMMIPLRLRAFSPSANYDFQCSADQEKPKYMLFTFLIERNTKAD